jgi:hypothetical protein
MINIIRNNLTIPVYEIVGINTGFGLKSTISTVLITPVLSPGLVTGFKNRALAHNSSLFTIPDTQFV